MPIQRSNSISTLSTTGSSQFTDARSNFVDADSEISLQQNDPTSTAVVAENFEDVDLSTTAVNNNSDEIKTSQPKNPKEPKIYVSKEEKIRQHQREIKRGYQREETQCQEYLFSNNTLSVLDLPSINTILCNLCSICCSSMNSSTSGQVGTAVSSKAYA